MATTDAGTAMATNGVDLVDEDDTGSAPFSLLEEVAHTGCADADEHLHKIGAADAEERHARLSGHGSCYVRLSGTRLTYEEDALRGAPAEALELPRIFKKLDDLLELLFRLISAGHIVECRFAFVFHQELCPALAE